MNPTFDRGATLSIECAGRDAFKAGIAATECPYAFIKTPCYPNQHARFDAEYRDKMNAWMRGWLNEQKRSQDK